MQSVAPIVYFNPKIYLDINAYVCMYLFDLGYVNGVYCTNCCKQSFMFMPPA